MAGPVLADTDVLIDFQAGEGAAQEVLRLLSSGRLRIPAVAWYELWRGAASDDDRGALRRMVRGAPVLILSRQDVEAAADLWARLTPPLREAIGDRDLLVAGTALSRGWPLFTRNRAHFKPTGITLHAVR